MYSIALLSCCDKVKIDKKITPNWLKKREVTVI